MAQYTTAAAALLPSLTAPSLATRRTGVGAGQSTSYDFGTLNVTNSSFSNNFASNGGAIASSSSPDTITDTTTVTMTIKNSTFTGNSSSSDGGAIFHSDGVLNISNCTLTRNSANNDGGAVDLYGYPTDKLQRRHFQREYGQE